MSLNMIVQVAKARIQRFNFKVLSIKKWDGSLVLLILIGALACLSYAEELPQTDISRLSLDITQSSVSGLSSGGYMATQFQLAHSEIIVGAGVVGAGPYYCALGSINVALGQCVSQSSSSITNTPFFAKYDKYLQAGKLAPSSSLTDDRVLMFHGTLDKTVNRVAANLLSEQYQAWLTAENFMYIDDKAFAHHMPTSSFGTKCDVSESPFLGNCAYDAAGEILSFIYRGNSTQKSKLSSGDNSASKTTSNSGLKILNIEEFVDLSGTSIADEAFIYSPTACENGEVCRLHVSFHGCNQSAQDVGSDYAEHSGFNKWADEYNIVVLYPQVEKSMFMPINPQGCWDWWGYTGEDYANKGGKQIHAVYQLMRHLSDNDS